MLGSEVKTRSETLRDADLLWREKWKIFGPDGAERPRSVF